MADVNIPDLSAAGTVTLADLVELYQPGETAGNRNRKATLAVLKALLNDVEIPIAVGDEGSALTTGISKVKFRLPFAMTVTSVYASVGTAPTGATVIVDINEDTGGGPTSILSTKLSIDATEKDSSTASTAAVISDASLAINAEITIDIDQVGSTIAGAGLKVWLRGYKTP